MKSKILLLIVICTILMSCTSSSYNYTPPSPMPQIENNVVVKAPKDIVWKNIIKGIAERFFVINNIDKASGLVNISYSGDPEKYVDGGVLNYEFSNLRGERKYSFPATQKFAQYELNYDGSLCVMTRRMELEGRMNILISEIDSSTSSVSVNTRYVLTMKITGYVLGSNDNLSPYQQTISFNTNQFGESEGGGIYYPNGEFEKTILDIVW
jgi:hypothetical protein